MKLYALHTFAHYGDHLQPIVEALRDKLVDVEHLSLSKQSLWGDYVHPTKLDPRGLWIVAGSVDVGKIGDRPYVYVEHGAGQTYDADDRGLEHASYSSGKLAGNPVLFVCPNDFVAARRRRSHPDVPVVVAGCPKLDPFHAHASGRHEGVESNVVAFAWHWDCQLVPETQTAWEHYRAKLVKVVIALRRRGLIPVAHAHPRIARRIRYHSLRMGFEWWDAEDVLTKAAVLCFDNTSLGFEFASLDRPVVVMNAPWYRRDVHHGMRFWECLPGEIVEGPDQLVDAIDVAMNDDDPELRRCVDRIYPLRDGRAAERAADAIVQVLGSLA